MSDSGEAFRPDGFGRKLGPLPLWGWALIGVGLVYLYYRFYGSGSGIVGAPVTAQTSNATPAVPGGSTSTGNGNGAPSFLDNQSWQNAAIQEASQFGATPLQTQQATDVYLNGGALTESQAGLINRVLGGLGAAPLGTLGTPSIIPPTVPKPPAPPAPKPVPHPVPSPHPRPVPRPVPHPAPERTYLIRRGDTLWGIARAHGTTVAHLAALNHIPNPNLIYAGHTLRLS